ncbi:MAG: hypothetical protein Q9M28_03455, partial [Mariprofundaceae bacterium]|nr:hypothetical protein [Mariprofundaceae bacterium]
LNRVAVVEVMYADNNFKRYKGMRVLGIDGSKVLLPHTTDIVKEFDLMAVTLKNGAEGNLSNQFVFLDLLSPLQRERGQGEENQSICFLH